MNRLHDFLHAVIVELVVQQLQKQVFVVLCGLLLGLAGAAASY